MANTYEIFISSAGDVEEERRIASNVVELVNRSFKLATLRIQVSSFLWEGLSTYVPERGLTIQESINAHLERCNAFVLILHRSPGSIEKGQDKFNVEREIEDALKMFNNYDMKMVFVYASELAVNNDPGNIEQQMRDLRDRIKSCGVMLRKYKNSEDFRAIFMNDLYRKTLQLYASNPQKITLKRFWQLGIIDGKDEPELAIVYHPVDRKYMQKKEPDDIWLQRLAPYIGFEDFKAIQMIEQSLKLSGFRDVDFQSYSESSAPSNIDVMNRIWLCLPRNKLAQSQYDLYFKQNKVRFRFSGSPESVVQIEWRSKDPKDWKNPDDWEDSIKVKSPLWQYLEMQRAAIPGDDWTPFHGKEYAKDFAILARFSDPKKDTQMEEGTLKDFFIAGIHGLGTWGAATLLEERFKLLPDSDHDFQMLLEVTYKNGRIIDVCDVSDWKQEDFEKANNSKQIREQLEKHNPSVLSSSFSPPSSTTKKAGKNSSSVSKRPRYGN